MPLVVEADSHKASRGTAEQEGIELQVEEMACG